MNPPSSTMISVKPLERYTTGARCWLPKFCLGTAILGLSLQVLANPTTSPKDAAAVPAAESKVDWSKVPPVTPMPRPGSFIVPPSGAGYYSLWDLLTGNERKAPPVAPYAPFGLLPVSSFDVDFRYMEKPGYEKDIFDPVKRIHMGSDWLLSFGGSFWFRNMRESGSRLEPGDNTYNLTRTRLHADLWYRDQVRLFAEGIDSRSFSQDKSPLGIDVNHTDMLNLFADIKIANVKDGQAYVRVGRQELLYGSQRLISTLDWANTRRTFQGVKTFWRSPKLDLDAFWVRPMNISQQSRTNFDNWDENRDFYGLWGTYKPQRGHFADLYFLSLDDSRTKTIAPTFNNITGAVVHTVGSRYAGNTNQYLYELEAMYQFGRSINQSLTPTDISAGAVAAGVGYQFSQLPMNPQLWLRYDYASGDKNANDGQSNTFNQLFPFGHYYMGFLDRVGRQNIHDFNAQFTLHPQPWFTFIAQYHRFFLANSHDALYNAAGVGYRRDATGQAGRDVGDELDLRFNIHVNRHQDILLGYSKLWAGDFIKHTSTTGGSGNSNISPSLIYVQYVVRF